MRSVKKSTYRVILARSKRKLTFFVRRENHIIDLEISDILLNKEKRKIRWMKEAIWRRRCDRTMSQTGHLLP